MIGASTRRQNHNTMGISLLDCCDGDVEKVCEKIYAKITCKAKPRLRRREIGVQ